MGNLHFFTQFKNFLNSYLEIHVRQLRMSQHIACISVLQGDNVLFKNFPIILCNQIDWYDCSLTVTMLA